MMKPIQFRKGSQINMNLLKLEIDRRFDVVTMMIKGMSGDRQQNRGRKVQSTYCQTQAKYLPLQEISNLNAINPPPMTSIISPTNSKRSKLNVNNENEFAKRFSITSKSKKLNPIQQCENQALRTSRCLLQSQKKKNKKLNLNLNQQSSKKNHSRYRALGMKTTESNSIKGDGNEVFNSFESTKKAILTEKKFFSSRNAKKFTTEEKVPVNFSVNSSIYELSKSNSNLSSRKSPAHFNDNISLNSSTNLNRKPNHSSFSTNNVTSSGFVSDYLIGDSFNNVPKRMIINEDIKNNIQAEFESKFENLKKKAGKQPKINNVRMALLKRLEVMHEKTVQVTK